MGSNLLVLPDRLNEASRRWNENEAKVSSHSAPDRSRSMSASTRVFAAAFDKRRFFSKPLLEPGFFVPSIRARELECGNVTPRLSHRSLLAVLSCVSIPVGVRMHDVLHSESGIELCLNHLVLP